MQAKDDTDAQNPEPLYFPNGITKGSRSLATFLYDYRKLLDFFFFSVHLADRADHGVQIASQALLKSGLGTEEERAKYQKSLENKGAVAKKLQSYYAVNSRHLVTTTTDLVLWYFSSIIQEAIKRRPDILKSGEQITYEEVLALPTRSAIVNYLIDKKINSLSYGGIRQMERYIKERLGNELFENDEERTLFSTFVELRNIYVHNRAIVNQLFISRIQSHQRFQFTLGKQYHVDYDEFATLANNAVKVASRLDQAIAQKFGVRAKRLSLHFAELGKP